MSMKFERDERKFDFHDIGCEIKRKRETSGMTQDQLAFIIDRDPRTIIYNENDGQHPSLNTFYQMVTMFDISVDQFFYPDMSADDACKKRINTLAALTLDRFGLDKFLALTEEKRLTILNAAFQCFGKFGYEKASMSILLYYAYRRKLSKKTANDKE